MLWLSPRPVSRAEEPLIGNTDDFTWGITSKSEDFWKKENYDKLYSNYFTDDWLHSLTDFVGNHTLYSRNTIKATINDKNFHIHQVTNTATLILLSAVCDHQTSVGHCFSFQSLW